MNTVLKYPGSKWNIAKWIISYFPDDYEKYTYLEPFFGSGAVFFNKNRSVIETINDIDSSVVNLFRVIRDNPEELTRLVEMTPWSREEYKSSYESSDNSVEDARRYLVRMWQAIGAKSSDITGWRNNIKGNNGNLTQFSCRLPGNILEVAGRLRHDRGHIIQIENQDAMKLIERHKRENVLIYVDPPYVLQTRNGRIYKHEFTDNQHIELLELLIEHPGPVIISGYNNSIYEKHLKNWNQEKREAQVEGGKVKTETIWLNYETHKQTMINYEEAMNE